VNCAATNASAAVVGAELDRIAPAGDAFVLPEKVLLLLFVGCEVFQRTPERTRLERNDTKTSGGEFVRQRASAGTSANDCEVHFVIVNVAAHRHP
jgi:hypothetical protein